MYFIDLMSLLEQYRQLVRKFEQIVGIGVSRIKRKLVLYFILISIVSISVSFEIILEVSESHFRNQIAVRIEEVYKNKFKNHHLDSTKNENDATLLLNSNETGNIFDPLDNLRIRIFLLIAVIIGTIITAFSLFSRDIAHPIDVLVAGARKLADGDLTTQIPVLSDDEIGDLGNLINDMNINLQELIVNIRYEMKRMSDQITQLESDSAGMLNVEDLEDAIHNRRIKITDFKALHENRNHAIGLMANMKYDLDALSDLVNMYKVYRVGQDSESGRETVENG